MTIEVTPREAEAIERVCGQHQTYEQAAHEMGISVRTLRHYIFRVAAQIEIGLPPLIRAHVWYSRAHPDRFPSPPYRIRGDGDGKERETTQ